MKGARTLVAALRRRPHRDKYLSQNRDIDEVERLRALRLEVTKDRDGCRVPSADERTRDQILDGQAVTVEDRALNRVRQREFVTLFTSRTRGRARRSSSGPSSACAAFVSTKRPHA